MPKPTPIRTKILVVDDNRDVLPMFELIADSEIEFIVASSGMDALAQLEKHNDVKAVLLDLAMPVFDGIGCVEEIRRNEAMNEKANPVKLAFLTGSTVDAVIHRVQIENNVERVFTKPIDPFQLVQELKVWLQLYV